MLDFEQVFIYLHHNFVFVIQITKNASVVSVRATWTVGGENSQKAYDLIANKRQIIDDLLTASRGVLFFLSCITATSTNRKDMGKYIRPGVAYFICFSTGSSSEEHIFAKMHDAGLDSEVRKN